MNVIVYHDKKEWKVLPEDDYVLGVFASKFETKLFCDQNGYSIIKNKCKYDCSECNKN
jgi:hypothetical protein